MKIDRDIIRENVNHFAVSVIHDMLYTTFYRIPVYFTGVMKKSGSLPTTAVILSDNATAELCQQMESVYTKMLRAHYTDSLGKNIGAAVPKYRGISFITKDKFTDEYRCGYEFYSINGDFYDSESDVLKRVVPLVSELLGRVEVASCKNADQALSVLKELRKKIGFSITGYVDVREFSRRQAATSQNALAAALSKDWVRVLYETYDFLADYGEPDRCLTNSEFGILNLILHTVEESN